MAGAGVLDGTLKLAFHRLRPDPFFGAKPTTYSFPSGHALISFCFYGLIAGMVNFQLEKRWQRALVWCAAGLLIGMIGLSRIYLGVHWPTDVVAGYAAAMIWMGSVGVMARRVEARRARRLAAST
jgi:undecaprenyl-diphosphatase